MKTFPVFTALLMLFAGTAEASNLHRIFRDVRLPTQKVIEFQEIDNPAAAGTTNVLNAHAGNTSTAAVTVTSFVAQPDVPRNLVITPGASTADVAACDVVVSGTNFHGDAITETLSFTANQSSATTGAKAFKTVTSVAFPANCEDSPFNATWSIGYGEKLGLKRCMANAGFWIQSSVSGTFESTRATIAADADEVEKNTADFNGTMDGSADFDAFFIQNYAQACQP